MAMVKDVVCGMEFDSESAAATSEYQGSTYYFCAVGCKEEFDANPQKYVSAGEAPAEMPAAAPAAQAPVEAPAAKRPWWQFWKR